MKRKGATDLATGVAARARHSAHLPHGRAAAAWMSWRPRSRPATTTEEVGRLPKSLIVSAVGVAERLREKGQMLMFSSEPAPPEPQCPPPCFRLLPVPSLRFSFSLSRSFSSATGAGFLEKMSVQRLEPPPPPPEAVGGAGEVIEAVGGGATVARRDASPSSGSGSGSATGGTPWLMALPLFFLDACFGGRTGSGRITPPAKSSSAQEGEAAGLGWSGQNSNSGEEDALLLLLASAASMAAWELEEPAAVCFLLRPIASEVVEVEGEGGERKVGRWQRAALYGWVREADEGH